MFNALNRFMSRLDSETPPHHSSYGQSGFQVLRNQNADLAIEPWFDFVVGINGRMIEDVNPGLFTQEVRNCAGSTLALGLWSAKGQRTRTVHIPIPPQNPSLGLSLQYTSLSIASTIWHILDVPSNSPADLAGLLPYSDYILGTPEAVLHGEAGLGELIEDHIGRPLRLYVYNNEYDVTRDVTIHPSRDWGGEGALGCTLGYGALHKLPVPLHEPMAGPGETLFSTENDGEPARFSNEETENPNVLSSPFVPAAASSPLDFVVPAQLLTPPPPPTTTASTSRRAKKHQPISGRGLDMDDYFNEGEKKSREVDHAPSRRSTPAPPPPQTGGLPKIVAGESEIVEHTTK